MRAIRRLAFPGGFRRKGTEFLGLGLTPEKLALTLALGATLGTLPLLCGTTLLCAIAAFLLRLNQAGIQIVNYLVYPLQLMFIIPYYRLGGMLFTKHAFTQSAYPGLLADAGAATVKAVAAWGLTAPVIAVTVYYVSLSLLRTSISAKAKIRKRPSLSLPGRAQKTVEGLFRCGRFQQSVCLCGGKIQGRADSGPHHPQQGRTVALGGAGGQSAVRPESSQRYRRPSGR